MLLTHLLAPLALAAAAAAGESGRGTGYIAVSTQERDGWNETVAVGVIDAPLGLVRTALADYEGKLGAMPYLVEARVLRVFPDGALVYNRTAVPFLTDYDFTLRVRYQEVADADGRVVSLLVHFTSANEDGPPPRDGVVRVDATRASWRLEPIDGGRRTRATYAVATRVGSVVPPLLEQWASRHMMTRVFEALSTRVGALRRAPQHR